MKIVVILSTFFLIQTAFSEGIFEREQNKVTRCLGQQELRLHKNKGQNFHYFLNQLLIQNFLQLKGVTLKDKYFNQACSQKKGAAFKIFRIVLTHFEDAFKIIPSTLSRSSSKGLRDKFILEVPEIFGEFMMHIKKTSPDAKCIAQNVPELLKLEENIFHLTNHMTFKQIIWRDRLIEKVLNKLKDPDFFYKKCNYKKKGNEVTEEKS